MYCYRKLKLADGSTMDEHRFIWQLHNGPIPKGMVVHHKNGNKTDNRLDNLELMSLASHARLHCLGRLPPRRPRDPCGTPASYKHGCRCTLCRQAHRDRMRIYRAKKKLTAQV